MPKLLKKWPPKQAARLQKASHGILLLDFDGTLAPIVRRPHLARLSPRLKKQLFRLSKKTNWTLGVVSGRDLATVRKKVNLSTLIYAGNHGYEILFPGKKKMVHPAARASQTIVARLCQDLKKKLKSIQGALVENKIYSATLHTRTLNPAAERQAEKIFNTVVKEPLKKKKIVVTKGKKVLEIRPPAPWDKGRAVLYILKTIKKKGFPIYMGDDRTDEDAFRVLKKKGWGIRVGTGSATAAHFSIPSVRQMPGLIRSLEKTLGAP